MKTLNIRAIETELESIGLELDSLYAMINTPAGGEDPAGRFDEEEERLRCLLNRQKELTDLLK